MEPRPWLDTRPPPTPESYPNSPQCVNVTVVGHQACHSVYGSRVTQDMLCAGVATGGKDSCQVPPGPREPVCHHHGPPRLLGLEMSPNPVTSSPCLATSFPCPTTLSPCPTMSMFPPWPRPIVAMTTSRHGHVPPWARPSTTTAPPHVPPPPVLPIGTSRCPHVPPPHPTATSLRSPSSLDRAVDTRARPIPTYPPSIPTSLWSPGL